MSVVTELIDKELQRRERRNLRDRLARTFLRDHPELVNDPEADINETVTEGTSEAAVRSIARHYNKMKKIRAFIRDGMETS